MELIYIPIQFHGGHLVIFTDAPFENVKHSRPLLGFVGIMPDDVNCGFF